MIRITLFSFFTFLFFSVNSQNKIDLDRSTAESHLRFLSSDELQGRETGSFGNLAAARYIAEQLRKSGVQSANDGEFYQEVKFKNSLPAHSGSVLIGESEWIHMQDILITRGSKDTISFPLVFANQAIINDTINDFEGLDVKGKMVLAYQGGPGVSGVQEIFELSRQKRKKIEKMGAAGLIEIFNLQFPWQYLANSLGRSRFALEDESGDETFFYVLSNAKMEDEIQKLKNGEELSIEIKYDPAKPEYFNSPNVVGIIPGSDPEMKGEYIILSAHYDHVGMRTVAANPSTKTDSIFNGARDNALGVTAILLAGEYFAKHPPKRSVLLIGFTAEEKGLLGSEYYVEHPLVPLEKCIFNLNIDGAGYNDTTIVSIFGMNRVGVEEELIQACREFGLEAFADPAPEQNLFDRSDNVNFAKAGIPAPTFSTGFKAFDQEIMKNYHQPSDEFETLNMNYLMKYYHAFTRAAELIANLEERPKWEEGDKYKEAAKMLYGSN